MWGIGKDVVSDVNNRKQFWIDDWTSARKYGLRIFAPSLYIFFASVLPAFAFGQQLALGTGQRLTVVHVLVSTAISGVVQSLVGGQPLLIIGVAEPIVLIYEFMYEFAEQRSDLGSELFLPWAAWVCCWTAVLVALVAVTNICRLVDTFTRMCGELFGMLIAVLFMQQAVKGLIAEFRDEATIFSTNQGTIATDNPGNLLAWRLTNGLWSLVLAFGFLQTALLTRQARTWRFGTGSLRGLLADYGVPFMVLVWSALSFAISSSNVHNGNTGSPADTLPPHVPRRVTTPHIWQVKDSWHVATRMSDVPGTYIAGAIIPAVVITVLFWFDHGVSSKMAQQKEYNLEKPPAYAWDMLLLSFLTLLTGLLGLPPVNGVLPQAPMHSKALASLRMAYEEEQQKRTVGKQEERAVIAGTGKVEQTNGEQQHIELADAHPQNSHYVACISGPRIATESDHSHRNQNDDSNTDTANGLSSTSKDDGPQKNNVVAELIHVPIRVAEQRVSNLLQSLLVAVCVGITYAIRQIPTAVVWGYFAYMAIESLPGSQFWDRLLLLFTDPDHRRAELRQVHSPYLERVPFRVISAFTIFQFSYLAGVWALTTWAGIGGVAFPVVIVLLVPIRQYMLPLVMKKQHLVELDAAEYDLVDAVPEKAASAEETDHQVVVLPQGHPPSIVLSRESHEAARQVLEGIHAGSQAVHVFSHVSHQQHAPGQHSSRTAGTTG